MLARANLSAAAAALRANDIETAERHLNATPLERRDWAWRHLASRLDQSLASAPIGDGEPAPGVNDYQRGSVSIWFALDGEPVYTARIARVGDTRRLLVEGRDPRTLECKSHWTLDGASFMLPDLRGDRLLVGERDGRLAERDAKSGAVLAGFDSPGEMPDRVWINGDSPGLAALEPVLDECTKPDSGVRVHATVDSATGHVIYQYRSDVWMEQLGDRSRINLPPHPEGFGWAAFSSDGRSVFTGGNDRRLMRIDLNGGARIAWTRDNAHTDAILAGAVAPDGAYIATGGQDGVFRFWDTPEGKPLGAWIGHRKPILAVAVSPDGGSIVSASADRVYRWSVDFRSPPNVLWRHDWFVQHLAMSPDGSLLAAAGRGAIAVFDVSTGLKLAEYPDIDANANILTFAFSPDGRGLLLWSRINKGRYIDLMAGQVRAWPRFDPPAMDPRYAEISLTNAVWEDPIERFALESATSPSGLVDVPSRTFVLVSPPERTLRVFRGEGIAGAWPIDLPLRFPLAFIDTGPSVVVATQDDRALMFNVGTGKVVGSFDGHTGTVTAAAVLEPGRLLVTGSEDRTIRLWDIPHRRELAELRGHLDTVRAIAVAPNGKTFFSASDDYTVRRWSTLSDAELARERVAHALASDRLRPEVDAILADDPDAAHAADRLAALADLTAREKAIGFQLLIQRAAERVPSRREQNRLHESAFDRP
ncbi:MAG: WD40 repeat domain-containing protein [Phycisphaeraceae bacterium]|nr:MAG: WD40 repeat domain-containing protein [Phycisphaeraceae bacterium]